MKFKSFATIKNFAQAIQRTAEADLQGTEATDVSSDNQKRLARRRNLMAVSCHTVAFLMTLFSTLWNSPKPLIGHLA
jgi:hypothetical protein